MQTTGLQTSMKKLINSPESVVRDALEGMAAAHADLLRVHFDPDYVVRTDAPVKGKVGLVSGGGSGHEPMHGGFVGRGMLDAACPGAVFTSPGAITLRHLLTHTAGFGYEFWNADVVRYQHVKGLPPIISCQNATLQLPLLFDPGDRWEYGINIDWVGKMVEAVSGKKLGVYLSESVFGPLGMNDTAFRITPAMRQRLAKVHQRGEDGTLVPTDLEIPQDPEFEMGGGGLYGTVGDYLKFVRMMLNSGRAGSEQVLKPETVELMSRNAMRNCKVTMLHTVFPAVSHDAEFFPGMPKGWGLSFMINNEQAPTGRTVGSLAWAGLANTYYWIDQTRGLGGVYATQLFPFADHKALPLFFEFEKAVYQG